MHSAVLIVRLMMLVLMQPLILFSSSIVAASQVCASLQTGLVCVAGLNEQDKYFMKACPAKKGDYFEFFAEIDILAALSTCPGGDLSVPLWGPNARDPLEVCRPLGVEVYKVHADALQGWQPPVKAKYAGGHGLSSKPWT